MRLYTMDPFTHSFSYAGTRRVERVVDIEENYIPFILF